MKSSKLSIFIRSYWDYYLDLEEDFYKTQKYVAFNELNNNVYSEEYLKLLQANCSEIDVVAKEIASSIDPDFKNDNKANIYKWGYSLQQKLPSILSQEVIFNHEIRIHPWDNWEYEQFSDKQGALRLRLSKGSKTPSWWTAYNNVKHARTKFSSKGLQNYTQANLRNVYLSLSALWVLETEYMMLLSDEQMPVDGIKDSVLFQPYFKQFDDLIY